MIKHSDRRGRILALARETSHKRFYEVLKTIHRLPQDVDAAWPAYDPHKSRDAMIRAARGIEE
jgi:hypothetical protein